MSAASRDVSKAAASHLPAGVAAPYAALVERFARLAGLEHASTYLSWDQRVTMPPGGAAARADSLAELAGLHHASLVEPATGDALDALDAALDTARGTVTGSDAGTTADDPAFVVVVADAREMRREYLQAVALPAALVRAKVVAGSACEQGWRVQRPANDWTGFLENFRPVVALAREEADARLAFAAARGTVTSRYETLLELYCPGDGAALVARVFDRLRAELPGLLARAMAAQAADPPPVVAGPFPLDAQRALGTSLATRLGFDFARGRLDVSLHPFSTGQAGDLRITTRHVEHDAWDALLATAHEIGHASYEGGLPPGLAGRPAGRARGMSVHESQSLFFEKHLFLSTAFHRAFANDAHACLPTTRAHDGAALRRARLGVRRSKIRVDADEVTYPLHVMLRHGIERDLVDGQLEPDAVPDAWDAGMRELLDVDTRGDFRDGCLQDIHWTDGAFGYFPSYTLGAVNAAQLAAALERDEPEWRDAVAEGDVGPVRAWLAAKVWRRGSTVDTATLVTEATGSPTDARWLLEHLERRYVERVDD